MTYIKFISLYFIPNVLADSHKGEVSPMKQHWDYYGLLPGLWRTTSISSFINNTGKSHKVKLVDINFIIVLGYVYKERAM